ncbi:MAG: ExbD/TolR family protein [Flavobacteriales bacterium]
MPRFKKKSSNQIQEINSAALPDIVFMLLFFFMAVTVIKKDDPLVEVNLPEAGGALEVSSRELSQHFFIGKNVNGVEQVQMNDAICAIEDIAPYLKSQHLEFTDSHSISVDGGVSLASIA